MTTNAVIRQRWSELLPWLSVNALRPRARLRDRYGDGIAWQCRLSGNRSIDLLGQRLDNSSTESGMSFGDRGPVTWVGNAY
jgi:hypothetical protein